MSPIGTFTIAIVLILEALLFLYQGFDLVKRSQELYFEFRSDTLITKRDVANGGWFQVAFGLLLLLAAIALFFYGILKIYFAVSIIR